MEEIIPQFCSCCWCFIVLLLWLAKLEMDGSMRVLCHTQTICEEGSSICSIGIPCSIDLVGEMFPLRVAIKHLTTLFRLLRKFLFILIIKLVLVIQMIPFYTIPCFLGELGLPSYTVRHFLGEWGSPAQQHQNLVPWRLWDEVKQISHKISIVLCFWGWPFCSALVFHASKFGPTKVLLNKKQLCIVDLHYTSIGF